jgi:hypothetical protein
MSPLKAIWNFVRWKKNYLEFKLKRNKASSSLKEILMRANF